MKKGTLVKYKIVEGREVLAIVRTAHKDNTFTVEARHVLENGEQVGSYLGYQYRMPAFRLIAA